MGWPVAKQGSGDSLCGIYALLNALCDFEEVPASKVRANRQREFFKHLIKAASSLGFLDYHHLVIGFEAFELKAIIEFAARNFGYPVVASLLLTQDAFETARKSLTKSVRALVAYADGEDHWVAITSGGVIDSWPDKQIVQDHQIEKSGYALLIERMQD